MGFLSSVSCSSKVREPDEEDIELRVRRWVRSKCNSLGLGMAFEVENGLERLLSPLTSGIIDAISG